MKKEAKHFLINLVIISLLFVLVCFSLVMALFNLFSQEINMSKILEISYLFIHIVALALLFFVYFNAFKNGSALIKNIMLETTKKKTKTKIITFMLVGTIFLLLAIYSSLIVAHLNLFLVNVIGYISWLDLMNGFYLLAFICFTFAFYPLLIKGN